MVLPTLRQLEYLVALSETRHFGRAAEACHVSQSALSAGIQELERLMGVTLVERTRRKVMLTPLGAEVLERAREILRGAEELAETCRAGGEPLSGRLRLGVIPTVGPYLLPRVLPTLRARYPSLRLHLREEQTGALLDALRAGRLDAVLLALPYDTGDLEVLELFDDPVHVACPADHPLAGKDEIPDEALRSEPLLLLEDGHCLRDHGLEACRLLRSDRNEVFQATSLSTVVHMVASGLGVTFVPELAEDAVRRLEPGVAIRPLVGTPGRRIALAWRPSAARGEEYALLGQVIREA